MGSTELFKLSEVIENKPVTYFLMNIRDEEILGGFKSELQKVKKNNGMYQIEKTLKSQNRKGKRHYLFVG